MDYGKRWGQMKTFSLNKNQRQFCKGCGASLTSADEEAQVCTQCGYKLQAEPNSLEFTLRASLRKLRDKKMMAMF